MKCSVCGAELGADVKVCPGCGAPVEGQQAEREQAEVQSAIQEPDGGAALPVQTEGAGEPPKTGKKKGIIIGAVAVVVVAVGALAFGLMGRKDPKEVVIQAFENIYTEDQVKPLEELFGLSQFSENMLTADIEDSVSMVLEDCSEAEIKEWAGSGIRILEKSDKTNEKTSTDIAVIYKDMELFNINGYYGDEVLMMAIPELSSKVFVLDLSDGLAERIEKSPLVGPALEASGMDVEGLLGYFQEQMEKVESGEVGSLDLDSLMTRYREGTQAEDKFKEALAVEKGEKGTFTMDGEEVTCSGYKVLVSKDSMMEFLRTTTDFFLNDEQLKDEFLNQLEQSVRLTELMGGVTSGISADQMYADSVDEVLEAVNEMIDFLDKSLTDVNMTVYVDKKGRLAAVDGSTQLRDPDSSEEEAEQEAIQISFHFELQGGSYLTQNMTAEVLFEEGEDEIKISMIKNGTYDGKQLTGDVAFDISYDVDGHGKHNGGLTCTGTYNADGGDYHVGMSVTGDDSLVVDISIAGVVDQLEKGISMHADIDEIKITVMDAMAQMTLSGDYSYGPLTSEVTEPNGESFDILATDESDWENVFMEVYMNVIQLISEVSLY